ncbi:ABC transporter permease [Halanaerobium sp. Z-7514]|uniref:ABC transporter permease n=1 Tax=Halanaerobium polyolivorans TaxID=2886943 RepID=A0AAW4X1I8_9FIRM|nr:ABC transporter permease [Halanaerobium polyolivorans]MCC3145702.1 ABC transporter permease [Halanaerobium polyolivorans]
MKEIFKKYGTIIGLLIIIISFGILRPNTFLSLRNWSNILQQISLLAIISIGATVVMVIKEFDLSISSVASFAGIITAGLLVDGYSMYLVIPAVLGLSFIFGLINGFFVAKLNILSFITTLSTGTFLGGITYWYSGGSIIFSGIPREFLIWGQGEFLNLALVIWIMFLIVLLFWYIFNQTMLGRQLYSIGGNEKAARYSGIKVEKKKIIAFGLTAVLSALTGILLASRLGSAHPTAGGGYLLRAYATVFLGMTLFKQGEANVLGTMVGVLIMGVLANGLTILNVPNYFQDMLTGSIIIAALVFQGMSVKSN